MKIGEDAFYACSSLENITIPSSVTKIGHWAFKECISLKQISIPFALSSTNLGIDQSVDIKNI